MKITCNYCGNLFDDTNAQCPHCGAPNAGVVRSAGSQPLTIEQLKEWYAAMGLPPAETTRFFIGEDYREPRAFGIYKDEKTGNFVVYKNKDSGARAIRYEGTDEAYAVNELYQRLKEEILQQKRAQLKQDSKSSDSVRTGTSSQQSTAAASKAFRGFLLAVFAPAICAVLILLGVFSFFLFQDAPDPGYYNYRDLICYYYQNPSDSLDTDWVIWEADRGEWSDFTPKKEMPKALRKNKTAKNYFVSETWNASLPCTDFTTTTAWQDRSANYEVNTGYYHYNDVYYYHLYDAADDGWYGYGADDGWYPLDVSDVPEELQHSVQANDFYYTPTWDSSTQVTDFTDTAYYSDYAQSQSSKDSDSWNNNDNDWSWSSSDSWDSGSTDWDSDW